MTLLAVAVGLLAVLTALNLLILLGVVRRLRTISATGGAPATSTPAEVLPPAGTRVGSFTLTAVDGTQVSEADLAEGRSLVVMLSPSCSPCRDTATKLAAQRDTLPDRTFILLRTEMDEPELDGMLAILDILAGVAKVATFTGGDDVEQAFASRGYPTGIAVENGVVTASSFTYTDVLPETVKA
jgi:hypothetical protein